MASLLLIGVGSSGFAAMKCNEQNLQNLTMEKYDTTRTRKPVICSEQSRADLLENLFIEEKDGRIPVIKRLIESGRPFGLEEIRGIPSTVRIAKKNELEVFLEIPIVKSISVMNNRTFLPESSLLRNMIPVILFEQIRTEEDAFLEQNKSLFYSSEYCSYPMNAFYYYQGDKKARMFLYAIKGRKGKCLSSLVIYNKERFETLLNNYGLIPEEKMGDLVEEARGLFNQITKKKEALKNEEASSCCIS